ncbi:MAG: ATP-dependent helicase C-terminal domain-containing protein [Pseudobdellovibrio sp.]
MISLPIDSHLPQILEHFKAYKNLILKASPGSGKTTRIPAALFHHYKISKKKIIVLVPKRIAAVSAADRIAEENNWTLGQEVGYHVRFEPMLNENTTLIFMTEGLFIKKASENSFWSTIGVLIFDEFHERSSLTDMALGLAVEKQMLDCENLKLIVMSATLNSKALESYLPDHQSIEIEAPPFALEVIYSTKPQRLVCDNEFYNQLTNTTLQAWANGKKDVLIFLPGFGEIRKAESNLSKKLPSVLIQILHSSIKLTEQKEILKLSTNRRIILATDIAESSLTLPSVDTVIDSGLKKVSTLESKIGFTQLELQRISLFSAKQRAGRAARLGPGKTYRMWHESDERSMPEQIKPEILSSSLIEEILTLKSCDVDDIINFMWLDRPPERNVETALKKLLSWQLIDPIPDNSLTKFGKISSLGRKIQNLPLSIESGLLFLKLSEGGFQADAAYLIACLESTDFSKVFSDRLYSSETDLDRLFANSSLAPNGFKIKGQLEKQKIKRTDTTFTNFREALLALFFKYLPYRIAKKKTALDGTSSLGRGVTLKPGLQANECDYYLLLAGFNGPDNKTEISFAVGFSKDEFLKFSSENILIERSYQINLEKRLIYKTDVKRVGQFIISESAKTPLTTKELATVWTEITLTHAEVILQAHPDYLPYIDKLNFLFKKKIILNYEENIFDFKSTLTFKIMNDLSQSTQSFEDIFAYPLLDLLMLHTPEIIKNDLTKLPDFFVLPTGKKANLDYLSENAPMVSVKIQDIFGWNSTPTLLDKRLIVTLELLAPNMRPTQVTQNLTQFWLISYFEIRKELKARYPRHPWPDNPAEYVHEKRK